ncbi:MAG: hypothetical protein JNL82_37515 [Myxococcales bacterium]|nr:hypothetical protein [Myxococcales bacterium]
MTGGLGFAVAVGELTARWPADGGGLELVSLECATGVGGGWARVRLGPPQGRAPAVGAPVSVDLDDGDGPRRVFTGRADHVGSTAAAWQLRAHDGLPALAHLDLERAWHDTTADAVLKDILAAAGLAVAAVCPGPPLRTFHALRGPRGLRVVEGLLARMGAELHVDGAGAVVVAAPRSGAADHTLTWGQDLLALDLRRRPPAAPGVTIFGEGAAESQGQARGHWLPRDVSALVGRAAVDADHAVHAGAAGQPGLTLVDGALAGARACQTVAENFTKLLAASPIEGSVTTLGRTTIRPGDLVAVAGLPDDHSLAAVLAGRPLRARRVVQRFDATGGFTTRVEL